MQTLREELRKVQSSAALLDRQRGPGLGYWSTGNAPDAIGPLSPASSRPPASSRQDSPVARSYDEQVELEYIRNVIFLFREARFGSRVVDRLRSTPQETRRLIVKV